MILYAILVGVGLILLGNTQPKIALAIAGIILLGAITLNPDLLNRLLNVPGGGGRSGKESIGGSGRT